MSQTALWSFRLCTFVATAVIALNADAREIDPGRIDCREFLASNLTVKADLIMWLRGYHAGKTGTIPFPSDSPYGGRLGFYCRQHPRANLIDASERILTDLDRGI